MDQKMRGPRPAEGRVNISYGSDGALRYRRSGHPDFTHNYNNSYTNPTIVVCMYTYINVSTLYTNPNEP